MSDTKFSGAGNLGQDLRDVKVSVDARSVTVRGIMSVADVESTWDADDALRVWNPTTPAGVAWKTWHAHLYGCTQCRTGERCVRGAGLLSRASRLAPIPGFFLVP